jgi:hypothetical protein
MTDCDAELKVYGNELHKVINVLRRSVADLEALRQSYK